MNARYWHAVVAIVVFCAMSAGAENDREERCPELVKIEGTSKGYDNVSLVGLIGSPREYDGCTIQTIGILGKDPLVIFFTHEDYEKNVTLNSVLLVLEAQDPSELTQVAGGRVIVRGRFRRQAGPGQIGVIDQVSRLGIHLYDSEEPRDLPLVNLAE